MTKFHKRDEYFDDSENRTATKRNYAYAWLPQWSSPFFPWIFFPKIVCFLGCRAFHLTLSSMMWRAFQEIWVNPHHEGRCFSLQLKPGQYQRVSFHPQQNKKKNLHSFGLKSLKSFQLPSGDQRHLWWDVSMRKIRLDCGVARRSSRTSVLFEECFELNSSICSGVTEWGFSWDIYAAMHNRYQHRNLSTYLVIHHC